MIIAYGVCQRALPLVAGGIAGGLAPVLLLGVGRGRPVSPDVLMLTMAAALAALTGIAKTTTV